MPNLLQNDRLKQDFTKYLSTLGISSESLKNYKSDISHFLGWAILKVRAFGSYTDSLSELLPFLSSNLISEYLNFQSQNNIPAKTINRRLSTLRHLSRFLTVSQILNSDFMTGIENVEQQATLKLANHPIVDQFKSYLQSQNISKNTVKNYVSDIKQFLLWLENNYQNFSSNR